LATIIIGSPRITPAASPPARVASAGRMPAAE
jgi:hypothetical protein